MVTFKVGELGSVAKKEILRKGKFGLVGVLHCPSQKTSFRIRRVYVSISSRFMESELSLARSSILSVESKIVVFFSECLIVGGKIKADITIFGETTPKSSI